MRKYLCCTCGHEFQADVKGRCPKCGQPDVMEVTWFAREANERYYQQKRLQAAVKRSFEGGVVPMTAEELKAEVGLA